MSPVEPGVFALRVAFEALRAGVPNRAAVLLLGSVEDALEERFEAGLAAAWHPKPLPGLLFGGGFGAGKSHMLGFLREVALRQNFVVSLVSVSKETPLSAPASMFSAALRGTVVPGHADDAVAVALAEVQGRPDALGALEQVVSAPDAGFLPIFAAILHLLHRPVAAPSCCGAWRRSWRAASNPARRCARRWGRRVRAACSTSAALPMPRWSCNASGSCRCCSAPPGSPAGAC